MNSNASTPEEYINELPDDRKVVILKIREVIAKNIRNGFEADMGYGMLSHNTPYILMDITVIQNYLYHS